MVGGTCGVIVVIISSAVLLQWGAANPRFAGELVFEAPPDWLPNPQNLAGNATRWIDAPRSLPTTTFTLSFQARMEDGVWGIWLRNPEDEWVIIALQGEYVTARRCASLFEILEDCPTFTEPSQGIPTYWKQFPFIQPAENTIRLDYENEQLTLRLNQEWMWDLPTDVTGQWGWWLRGTQGEWQDIRIWQAD